MLPDWAKSHQNDKKSPKWQKFSENGNNLTKWQKIVKVAKNCQSGQIVPPDLAKSRQIGKKSPKWLKVLKLGSKGFQGVSDGSRSQTAWARTTRGTYARAPYAFAALGQGPKGPELVIYI